VSADRGFDEAIQRISGQRPARSTYKLMTGRYSSLIKESIGDVAGALYCSRGRLSKGSSVNG